MHCCCFRYFLAQGQEGFAKLQGESLDCFGLLVFIPKGRNRAENPLAFLSSCTSCLDSVFQGLGEGDRVWGEVL